MVINKLTYCVDVDDCISKHINRDYENAIPYLSVIEKINNLYNQGHIIKLFTARGMVSSNGDIVLARQKNEIILKKWLDKNNVFYHELIFGKPLYDCFIDDKAINLRDFMKSPEAVLLHGGSGSSIYKVGDTVIKYGNNIKAQYDWFEEFEEKNKDNRSFRIKIPQIYSFVVNKIFMEYIEQYFFDDEEFFNMYIQLLIEWCFENKKIPSIKNDPVQYIDRCRESFNDPILEDYYDILYRAIVDEKATYAHCDLTIPNTIVKLDEMENINIYLLDPHPILPWESYLLDLANIRFSLNGFMKNLAHDHRSIYSESGLEYFDNLIYSKYDSTKEFEKLLKKIKIIEISLWIRMKKYRDFDEQEYVKRKIQELICELKNVN